MAPPFDLNFSSSQYQESHLNQERPVSNHNSLNSMKMEYGLNNHFINDTQASIGHSALNFNNFVPTTFVGDNRLSVEQSSSQCEISDTTQRDDFQQEFNQKNHSQYAHIHQNIGEELLCSKPQIDVPGDFTLFPISQDLESYESSSFVNDIQKIQPINLSQLDLMCPQGQSSINPPSVLQLDPSSTAPAHPSSGFGNIQFESSPNNTNHSSMGPLVTGLFHTGSQDWNLCQPQFIRHRRAPSEYSEVSATSAQQSPNIIHQLNFDQQNSPMQNAQDSNLYQEVLIFDEISISDPQVQHGQSTRSSAHSPAISPRLDAHKVANDDSILGALGDGLCHSQQVFPHEPFPLLNSDTGQAKQMITPEINVEFAPLTRQNTFESQIVAKFDKDALTPPEKGRRRAFTDTTRVNPSSHSRSHSSCCILPQQNPNLSECSYQQHRSLSPHHGARLNSPIRLRRLSTPSILNRDHNISLINTEYQNTVLDNVNSKRGQRHPATFLCTLCPKKFTRAYNLRSHLRTHTDERPFTCRVCSKAFARQHDRKRHEELHSGKKKFICKGELKQGGQWGCGRRFARADALGRHFRSEAGRGCINLLLDEEARERQRLLDERQMQDMQQAQSQSLLSLDVDNLSSHFMLPAALLAQYPALATLSWSELPQNDTGIEDDPSGRSSFEASGSEYYDDVDEKIYN